MTIDMVMKKLHNCHSMYTKHYFLLKQHQTENRTKFIKWKVL